MIAIKALISLFGWIWSSVNETVKKNFIKKNNKRNIKLESLMKNTENDLSLLQIFIEQVHREWCVLWVSNQMFKIICESR